MTQPLDHRDELAIVLTALYDLTRPDDDGAHLPATAAEVASQTRWPGARTFGRSRTSRLLAELVQTGCARRRRPQGSPFVYAFVGWDGLPR